MPTDDRLCFAYIGNFGPPHSTETHVASAIERVGHCVERFQENDPTVFGSVEERVAEFDVVLWTRTGWDWPSLGLSREAAQAAQHRLLARAAAEGTPTVGFHLDRWWGLDREGQVGEEAFFRCSLVCTADGGHDEDWRLAGVEHRWFPPGVSEAEALRIGTRRPEIASPVGFVGSWRSYHPEWLPWRRRLIEGLSREFGSAFRTWEGGVRGQDLADLYASVDVLVGDSCLAGGVSRYWSDRIPETLGRGGFLIHPRVDGIEDHYADGEHLALVPPEDLDAMIEAVRTWLASPVERTLVAAEGREHVLRHHTYERRIGQLVELLRTEGRLP